MASTSKEGRPCMCEATSLLPAEKAHLGPTEASGGSQKGVRADGLPLARSPNCQMREHTSFHCTLAALQPYVARHGYFAT